MKLSLLLCCSAAGTLFQGQTKPPRPSRRNTKLAALQKANDAKLAAADRKAPPLKQSRAISAGTNHQKGKLVIERKAADMDYSVFLNSVYDCLKVRDVYDGLVEAIKAKESVYQRNGANGNIEIPSGCQDNCQNPDTGKHTHIEAYVQSGCALFLSGCDIRPMTDLDVWIPQLLLVLDNNGRITKNDLGLGGALNWGHASWENKVGTTDKGKAEANRQIYCPPHTRDGIDYWEVDIYIGPGGILDTPALNFLNSRMIYGAREVMKNVGRKGGTPLMRYTPTDVEPEETAPFEMRMYTPSFCHMLELKMLLMTTGRNDKKGVAHPKTTDRDDIACVAPRIAQYFKTWGSTAGMDNIGVDPDSKFEGRSCSPPSFLDHVPKEDKTTDAEYETKVPKSDKVGAGDYYKAKNYNGDEDRAKHGTFKPAHVVRQAWCHCKMRGAFDLYLDKLESN